VWLQYISSAMPLTYVVKGLRESFTLSPAPIIFMDIFILFGFFLLFVFVANNYFKRKFE
jgi:ABC-type multidrug transport system permease subunit